MQLYTFWGLASAGAMPIRQHSYSTADSGASRLEDKNAILIIE